MALPLELLHATLDAAINVRRSIDLLDVSSAIGGVRKSDNQLAKNISSHSPGGNGHAVLAALFLVSDAKAVAEGCKDIALDWPPAPHADPALHALYIIRTRSCECTRAEGIRRLAATLCDFPSADLLRVFNKDQLIALRDLIGFASISGISDDPDASVSSVAASMKAVTAEANEEHAPHD